MLRLAIETVLALLSLCGIAFYLIAFWSAFLFHRERGPGLANIAALPVSILKPLKGSDSQTYAALRSHCEQDYGAYQIIFGVNEPEDAAVPVVQRIIAEFPDLDIRLVVCSEVLGANRKVSNLIHLLREAKYPHVLVNDGDIKVGGSYLRSVMAYFADPETGMVTCPYKGTASSTLASRLEALGISTDFIPGVLTSRYIEDGLHFALGSTLAMSRTALDKICCFAAVIDYLADDYQLGERISKAGFKVALAHEVVETSIPPYSFAQFWEHQLRWARTMRISRPGGYRGLALTFGLPWAILLALVAPHSWWSWTILVAAALARASVAIGVGLQILRDRQVLRELWLLPLRDLLALALWAWSYMADTVTWRGEKFRLENGRMFPISVARHATPANVATESHRR
jgi:ceramide glucosyltransferase